MFSAGAMASTEVRQKLHDFLMSKSAKDPSVSGAGYPLSRSKLWYRYISLLQLHSRALYHSSDFRSM